MNEINENDTAVEKKKDKEKGKYSVPMYFFEVLLTVGFIIGFLGGIVVGLNAI